MVSQEALIRTLTYIATILIFFGNGTSPTLVFSASNVTKTDNVDVENFSDRSSSATKDLNIPFLPFTVFKIVKEGERPEITGLFTMERIEAPSIMELSHGVLRLTRTTAGNSSSKNSLVLADLYFDSDRNRISDDAALVIEEGTKLLKRHEDLTVNIETHCDERGVRAYNMALGNKRAQAIQDYLVDLGVSASRITALSYGHEKPLCTERSLTCWEDNLRIQNAFRLLAITQSRNGCLVRLTLLGELAHMRPATQLVQRQPFLQKIRVGRTRF